MGLNGKTFFFTLGVVFLATVFASLTLQYLAAKKAAAAVTATA